MPGASTPPGASRSTPTETDAQSCSSDRRLTNRFDNSAEFSLEDVDLEAFLPALYESGHFLVYTGTFEQEGIYVVADPSLREKPHLIEHLLTMAFLIDSTPKLQTGSRRASATGGGGGDADTDTNDEGRALGDSCYLLALTPSQRFFWQGPIMHMPLPLLDLDLQDLRVRLIADGPNARLAEAKDRFLESLVQPDTDEGDAPPPPIELECIVEQQAHLPSIQRELRRIGVATIRLSEAIVESVSHVRLSLHGVPASQELVENWFAFSSDHGQRVGIYMDGPTWARFSRLLMRLAINWVAFICEDCDPTDHKTFRWTVNALEFAMVMTRGNNILHLDRGEFALLQEKVASCMALLISHFDILGARSSFEAKKEQERLAELRSMAAGLESAHDEDGVYYRSASPSDPAGDLAIKRLAGEWPGEGVADKSVRLTHETRVRLIQTLEEGRSHLNYDMHIVGRVVNTDRPEDRSLVALAASSSNISIHWQQGRFIGAGAYGKVYTAHNMDQNTVMAVKEIRFSDVSNLPTVYKEIRDESSVMQMLNHVNIVEYYGIEVHRDKVYIFQEYCDGGSLKDLLEHGRIEQEEVIMNYTCQILEGLQVRRPPSPRGGVPPARADLARLTSPTLCVAPTVPAREGHRPSRHQARQCVLCAPPFLLWPAALTGLHPSCPARRRPAHLRCRHHQARRLRRGQGDRARPPDDQPHADGRHGLDERHADVHVARGHQEHARWPARRDGHLVGRVHGPRVCDGQEAVAVGRKRVGHHVQVRPFPSVWPRSAPSCR